MDLTPINRPQLPKLIAQLLFRQGQQRAGLLDAFPQKTLCDKLSVVVSQISLFTQAVQNSNRNWINAQRMDQTLQCGLVMTRLAR